MKEKGTTKATHIFGLRHFNTRYTCLYSRAIMKQRVMITPTRSKDVIRVDFTICCTET